LTTLPLRAIGLADRLLGCFRRALSADLGAHQPGTKYICRDLVLMAGHLTGLCDEDEEDEEEGEEEEEPPVVREPDED